MPVVLWFNCRDHKGLRFIKLCKEILNGDSSIFYVKSYLWQQASYTYLLSSYQVVALSSLVGPLDLLDPLAYQVAYLSHK
jgi:hypothetical protein